LRLAPELAPDLIVVDVHLPDMNGIEVTRQLLRRLPSVKVVVFSSDPARSLVDEALQAGASAYILKQTAAQELLQAIDLVMAGRLYLSPAVSADILADYRKSLTQEVSPPWLSDRDKLLLRLVAEGRRNKEIAAELALSSKSIEAYRSRLMKKLGCSSAAELVRYAIREGIAAPRTGWLDSPCGWRRLPWEAAASWAGSGFRFKPRRFWPMIPGQNVHEVPSPQLDPARSQRHPRDLWLTATRTSPAANPSRPPSAKARSSPWLPSTPSPRTSVSWTATAGSWPSTNRGWRSPTPMASPPRPPHSAPIT
jgi:DNA-binding NarL/FixJ family response regulator